MFELILAGIAGLIIGFFLGIEFGARTVFKGMKDAEKGRQADKKSM